MENLKPLLRNLPVPLFLYGLVRSIFECLEMMDAMNVTLMNADSLSGMRVVVVPGYVRALDSFFFYAALAAILTFAIKYEEGNH